MPISFNSFKEQIQESLEPIAKKIDVKGPNVSKLFMSCVNALTGSTPETRSRTFTKLTQSRFAGLMQQVLKKPAAILNPAHNGQKNGAAKNEIVQNFEKALSDRFDKSAAGPRQDMQELGKMTLDTLKKAHDSGHLTPLLYKTVLIKAEKAAAALQARDLGGSDYDLAKQLTHELQSCSDESFKQKLSEFVFRSPSSEVPTADQAARKAYVDTHQFVSEILGTVDESIADLQAQLPKDLQLSLTEVCTIVDSVMAKGSDFSVAREMTVEVNGKSVTVISRLDSDGKPDVLISCGNIDAGAAAIVTKWVSIKTQKAEVHKVETEIAAGSGVAKNGLRLERLRGNDSGIRELSVVQENGQPRQVIAQHFFENGGMGRDLVARQAKENICNGQNGESVTQAIEQLYSKFTKDLASANSTDEKKEVVRQFRESIGESMANVSMDKFAKFQEICTIIMRQLDQEAKV